MQDVGEVIKSFDRIILEKIPLMDINPETFDDTVPLHRVFCRFDKPDENILQLIGELDENELSEK